MRHVPASEQGWRGYESKRKDTGSPIRSGMTEGRNAGMIKGAAREAFKALIHRWESRPNHVFRVSIHFFCDNTSTARSI